MLLLLLAALLIWPAAGSCYCVYNHTNVDLVVYGESCSKCYYNTISHGHHGCCPGGEKGCGGHTYITIAATNTDGNFHGYLFYVPTQVTNHGWVSFFGTCTHDTDSKSQCDNVTAKVHNNDGKVIYDGGLKFLHGGAGTTCKDD